MKTTTIKLKDEEYEKFKSFTSEEGMTLTGLFIKGAEKLITERRGEKRDE